MIDPRIVAASSGYNRRLRLAKGPEVPKATARVRDIWLAALSSFAFSLAFLAVRNIYDDELRSFEVILNPFPQLLHLARTTDVHPPGMYLLSRIAFLLTGSERWMTVLPLLVLYAGLVVFAYRVRPLLAQRPAAWITAVVLIFWHPQLLLWGNSVRWYPYWTGLALILLAGTLLAPVRSASVARLALLGLALAAMLYLSYATLTFALAFVCAWAFRWGVTRTSLRDLAILAGTAAVVAAPQLPALLLVHIPNSGTQRSSLVVSAARLFHGMVISEAMFPWQPVGLIFAFGVALPLGLRGAWTVLRDRDSRALGSLAIWCAVLAILAVASGLGGKARTFIVLCPAWGVLVGAGLGELRRSWGRWVAWGVTAAWLLVGCAHELGRERTAKSGLNDRVDEVVNLVTSQAGSEPALIVSYDPATVYALNEARIRSGRPWTVCSAYPDAIHGIPAAQVGAQPKKVFVVRSFVGSLLPNARWLDRVLSSAEAGIVAPSKAMLSKDPDWGMKRRVPGMGDAAAALPEYRFVVTYGDARAGYDFRPLEELARPATD